MVTGTHPSEHGIVGNGWFDRELAEVLFWRQANGLVHGDKLWQAAKRVRPDGVIAKLFWWYNMYAPVDVAVTPRPHYTADGRKIPGIYTKPAELSHELEERFGPFPLFNFWGPAADIRSSLWICEVASWLLEREPLDLLGVYVPHLDYSLQRFGPTWAGVANEVAEVDRVVAPLIDKSLALGGRVVVVSEYGLVDVNSAVFPNRVLREHGFLSVRESQLTGELLDAGASRAFAVCDHQVAHVYVREHRDVAAVHRVLKRLDGVDRVLDGESKKGVGLDHARSGELILLSCADRWFAYPYWLDDACAPDFAATVDIHRKPGYDPLELFLKPGLRTRARLLRRIVEKKIGLRCVFDVIPTDSSMVRGSHGLRPNDPARGPLLLTSHPDALSAARHSELCMTSVKDLVLRTLAMP